MYRWLLSSYPPWITAEALILIGLLTHSILHHIRINHDCAACLQVGQMLLDGRTLYVDFFDVNLPAIFYLNMLPAAMARYLSQPPTLSFAFCVGLMVALSWAQLRVAVRRTPMRGTTAENSLITLAWLAANGVIYLRGDYGQREHLFALAYLPALAARAVCLEGGHMPRSTDIWLGIQAGIGACIKPHFVLIVLAVEGCFLLCGRRWKALLWPDALAFICVLAAYALHWLVLPAAMRDGFLNRSIPFALHGYRAYERSLGDLIGGTPMTLFLAVAAAVWLMFYARIFRRQLLMGFVTAAVAGLAICFVQRKAWTYHYIPFEMAGALAAAVLLVQLGRALAADKACRRMRLPALLWLFFMAMSGGGIALRAVAQDGARFEQLQLERGSIEEAIVAHTLPGERVIVFSTSCEPAEPLFAQAGLQMGQRCGCFMVAAANFRPGSLDTAGRVLLASLQEDIGSRQSRLIVVRTQPGCQGCPADFRLSDYFREAGLLQLAQQEGYSPIPSPEGWAMYEYCGR
jgi:hypothetical protein